jgi:hypothetical protein
MGIGICLSCLRAPPEEPAVSWKSMTYLLISRELVVVDSSVSIDAGAAEHPADDQLADPQPVAIERLEVKHHSLSLSHSFYCCCLFPHLLHPSDFFP